MIKLYFIGTDDWGCLVYKDESGKIWKDVNLGYGIPNICSSSGNSFDGEPDMPIKDEFEIINEDSIPDKDMKFQYMMLSRLKCDCDYFLGNGNRCSKYLWGNNVTDHIKEMKSIWNRFLDEDKPEWLTFEQILNYEKEMMDS